MTMDVDVVEADAARADDLDAVFGARGDASRCWCRWFVDRGPDFDAHRSANREALRADIARERPPSGLVAYRAGAPVGWAQVGPVARFPLWPGRAHGSGDGVWALTCFVVRVGYRRSGVPAALLRASVEHAAAHGAHVLRARPVDTAIARKPSNDLYTGVLSTFLAAGFEVLDRNRSMTLVERRLR